MAATVPESRNTLIDGAVRIARSVRAVTWIDAARLHCWLAGRGSMDVPVHAPGVTISGGASSTFRYRTRPRYQTTRYAYGFVLRGASPGVATVTIPSGGDAYSVPVGTRDRPRPYTIPIDRAARSSAEAELTFDVAAPAGLDVTIESLSVEAMPRMFVDTDGSDLGADRLRHFARQPIVEPYFASELLHRQGDLRDACRRVGALQLSRGTSDPWVITAASPSWDTILDDAIGLLGRLIYSGDIDRPLIWYVLAKCSDGSTSGTVRVNSHSQGTPSSVISVPTSTTDWTWLGGDEVIVDAEDNTTVDGLRGGNHDDHTWQGQRTAGSGTISVATISVYEA